MMELSSYPNTGPEELIYEEVDGEPNGSHAVDSAEYFYDEGGCDHQVAGSSSAASSSAVKYENDARSQLAVVEEEELYDDVGIELSESQKHTNAPLLAADPLAASDENGDLIQINSALHHRLTLTQRCLGVMFSLLFLLVVGGGVFGYILMGDIRSGQNELSDSLKLYCDRRIENATSVVSDSLRTEIEQSTINISTAVQDNTQLVRSEINGMQSDLCDTQLNLQRILQLSDANCNFEFGFCLWTQSCADDFDWTRKSGPTGSASTGPTTDHTKGTSEGHYLYIEATNKSPGQYAIIESRLQAPTGSSHISFYYHMYGSQIASLGLYTKGVNRNMRSVWSKSGDQGDQWLLARVRIDMSTDYQFVFKASRGDDYTGDIAIDDITFTSDSCHG